MKKEHKKDHNPKQEEGQAEPEPQEVEAEVVAEGGDEVPDFADATFLQDVEAMRQELEQERTRATEYLDGWKRTQADFANYKRRIDRDQAQVYQNAAGSVIKRFIDVVDDLDRALQARPRSGEGEAWANGIELIYRKLLSILEAEGVTQMNAEGQHFDPNYHEAVTQEDSPTHESGQIISVVKQGYMLGDRVLRPALVRVAR
jgi:molecular chaperone GrpE